MLHSGPPPTGHVLRQTIILTIPSPGAKLRISVSVLVPGMCSLGWDSATVARSCWLVPIVGGTFPAGCADFCSRLGVPIWIICKENATRSFRRSYKILVIFEKTMSTVSRFRSFVRKTLPVYFDTLRKFLTFLKKQCQPCLVFDHL